MAAAATSSGAFLFLHQDDVRHQLVGRVQNGDRGIDHQIAHANVLADHQLADIDIDEIGNVQRQALDIDFPHHELEDSALDLDARSLTHTVYRNFNAQLLGQIDALQVDMQQLVADRIDQPVLQNGAGGFPARNREIQDAVVTGLGVQHGQQRLGIERDRKGVLLFAVEHRGHTAAGPQTAGDILGSGDPRFGGHCNRELSHN